jgi:hypothetical protein
MEDDNQENIPHQTRIKNNMVNVQGRPDGGGQ